MSLPPHVPYTSLTAPLKSSVGFTCRGVSGLAFGAGGGVLYSVGVDGQVAELDGATGRVLAKFKGGKKGLSGLALSPGEITGH